MPDPYSRSVEIPVKLVSANADVEIPSHEPLTAIPTAKLDLLKKIRAAAISLARAYDEMNDKNLRAENRPSDLHFESLKHSLQDLLDQYAKDWESVS